MDEKKHEIPVFSGRLIRKIKLYVMVFAVICLIFVSRMMMLFVIAFLTAVVLTWQEKNIMKKCIWSFEEEGARRVIFRFECYVPYEEIYEALQHKKVKIGAASFKIPKGRGNITFYYEVGNDKVQKEIIKSYKFLMSKVNVKIPRLSLRVIQHMDRSYLYWRDRRNCVFLMLISAAPMIFAGDESLPAAALFIVLGQLVQYFMLERLFKGIYFGKKEEETIGEMFSAYTNVKIRRVKASYGRMVWAVLLSAAANLGFLFAGWRLMCK